jgi:hypothetical protein
LWYEEARGFRSPQAGYDPEILKGQRPDERTGNDLIGNYFDVCRRAPEYQFRDQGILVFFYKNSVFPGPQVLCTTALPAFMNSTG